MSPCPGGHHSSSGSAGQSTGKWSSARILGSRPCRKSSGRPGSSSPRRRSSSTEGPWVIAEFISSSGSRTPSCRWRRASTWVAMTSRKVVSALTSISDLGPDRPILLPWPPLSLTMTTWSSTSRAWSAGGSGSSSRLGRSASGSSSSPGSSPLCCSFSWWSRRRRGASLAPRTPPASALGSTASTESVVFTPRFSPDQIRPRRSRPGLGGAPMIVERSPRGLAGPRVGHGLPQPGQGGGQLVEVGRRERIGQPGLQLSLHRRRGLGQQALPGRGQRQQRGAPVGRVGPPAHPPRRLQPVHGLAGGPDRDRDVLGQVVDPAVVPPVDDPQELELPHGQPVLAPQPFLQRVVQPRLVPDQVPEHPRQLRHRLPSIKVREKVIPRNIFISKVFPLSSQTDLSLARRAS